MPQVVLDCVSVTKWALSVTQHPFSVILSEGTECRSRKIYNLQPLIPEGLFFVWSYLTFFHLKVCLDGKVFLFWVRVQGVACVLLLSFWQFGEV